MAKGQQQLLERQGIDHEHIALEGAGHTPLDRADEFMPKAIMFLEKYF